MQHLKPITLLSALANSQQGKNMAFAVSHLGVRVLCPSGIGAASESGKGHVGHQGVIDREVRQLFSIWGPPVRFVRLENLLWKQKKLHHYSLGWLACGKTPFRNAGITTWYNTITKEDVQKVLLVQQKRYILLSTHPLRNPAELWCIKTTRDDQPELQNLFSLYFFLGRKCTGMNQRYKKVTLRNRKLTQRLWIWCFGLMGVALNIMVTGTCPAPPPVRCDWAK